MTKRLLINALEQDEVRVAITVGGELDEFFVERTDRQRILGNVYKARVLNVEAAFQAAFVDFGGDRNGFLHASDVMPAYEKPGDPEVAVNGGDRRRSGSPLAITDLLRPRQEVLVQVTKEEMGDKGPSLTTYISLPGRYLVLMPSISRCGISRKIEDERERRRVRRTMAQLDPPTGMGYIVRTAGVGRTAQELQGDLDYLLHLWASMTERIRDARAPARIYEETDLVMRALRDSWSADLDEVVVDDSVTADRVREFLQSVSPRDARKVKLHDGREPILHHFRIEEQIEAIDRKKVPLPSGGSIVIEQTEALVAIDVNSGKCTDEKNLEDTAHKTNVEAAREIARQLRLRDYGGVIVSDFIDMRDSRHRRNVERALREALRRDRARTKVARMSPFGVIEMTRQRIRTSKRLTSYRACPFCQGAGVVRTPDSLAAQILRRVRMAFSRKEVAHVEVRVPNDTADFLMNRKRRELSELEASFGKTVKVSAEPSFIGGEMSVTPFSGRGQPLPV